jgi:hypothetical protein
MTPPSEMERACVGATRTVLTGGTHFPWRCHGSEEAVRGVFPCRGVGTGGEPLCVLPVAAPWTGSVRPKDIRLFVGGGGGETPPGIVPGGGERSSPPRPGRAQCPAGGGDLGPPVLALPQLTFTSMAFGASFSLFGIRTVSTPSWNSAFAFSPSAAAGSVKERRNAP